MVQILDANHSMEDFNKIINEKPKVVVDFTASWCGPCNIIGPIFCKLADEHQDMHFVKVDVDDSEEIAEGCEVEAMPTFHFYKDGKKIDEMSGSDEGELKEKLEKHKSS